MEQVKSDRRVCPCGSGKEYESCCELFHEGALPPDALSLMRSRYVAYVLNLPVYLIQTTHPSSPYYDSDVRAWTQKITEFSTQYRFEKLEILDFKEGRDSATVTFVAHLSKDQQDATFTENSYFEKRDGRWLYHSGELSKGYAPHLIPHHR